MYVSWRSSRKAKNARSLFSTRSSVTLCFFLLLLLAVVLLSVMALFRFFFCRRREGFGGVPPRIWSPQPPPPPEPILFYYFSIQYSTVVRKRCSLHAKDNSLGVGWGIATPDIQVTYYTIRSFSLHVWFYVHYITV